MLLIGARTTTSVSNVSIGHGNALPTRCSGPAPRRFKLLCATRGLSIRAEVSRLIEQELAKVDDIDAALRAVLGPRSQTSTSPTGHLISQPLLGLELSTYPQATITPTPFTAAFFVWIL